jgi:hypothetical protein
MRSMAWDRRTVVGGAEEGAPRAVTEPDGGRRGLADGVGAGQPAEVAAEPLRVARLVDHRLHAGDERS